MKTSERFKELSNEARERAKNLMFKADGMHFSDYTTNIDRFVDEIITASTFNALAAIRKEAEDEKQQQIL